MMDIVEYLKFRRQDDLRMLRGNEVGAAYKCLAYLGSFHPEINVLVGMELAVQAGHSRDSVEQARGLSAVVGLGVGSRIPD